MPTYEDIGFLIDSIEYYIIDLCQRISCYAGYDTRGSLTWKPCDGEKETDKLMIYLDILRDMQSSLLVNDDNPCLCSTYFLELKDKVISIIGLVKEGVGSQRHEQPTSEWLANNPGMITFEKWERALYELKPEFVFDIQENIKVVPEVSFEIEEVELEVPKIDFEVKEVKVVKPVFNFEVIENESVKKKIVFDIVENVSNSKKIEFTVTEKEELSKSISFEVIEKIESKGICFDVVEKAVQENINFTIQEGCLNVITEDQTLLNL